MKLLPLISSLTVNPLQLQRLANKGQVYTRKPLKSTMRRCDFAGLAATSPANEERIPEVPSDDGDAPTDYNVLDAIVIGSGWAGLGAANVLAKNDLKFVVLEARDYVGGRSHSTTLDHSVVELGSQWIQGTTTSNPIQKLVQSYKAPTKTSGNFATGVWSDEYQSSTPHRVNHKEYRRVRQELFWDGWFPFQRQRQQQDRKHNGDDSSLRATTDLYIQTNQLGMDDQRALEFLLDTIVSQEYAASLDDMSTLSWNQDEWFGGGDAILTDGYTALIDAYAKHLCDRINLHCQVTTIDWSDKYIVSVTYVNAGVLHIARAHNVIVTVPLGVLQANRIVFQPEMPPWKATSIARLGSGLLNKLIVKWDASTTLPWPSNVEWLHKIATPQGKWTEFYSHQPTTGEKIVVAFSAGRHAVRIEQLTDHQALAEMITSLEQMFGTSIPTPTTHYVTRWNQDEFALGSYSYYKVGSLPQDRTNLGATLGGRVYFAGEACHLLYPSTTHGALMTGLERGKRVVKSIRKQAKRRGKTG